MPPATGKDFVARIIGCICNIFSTSIFVPRVSKDILEMKVLILFDSTFDQCKHQDLAGCI